LPEKPETATRPRDTTPTCPCCGQIVLDIVLDRIEKEAWHTYGDYLCYEAVSDNPPEREEW